MAVHLRHFIDPFTGAVEDLLEAEQRVTYRGTPLDAPAPGHTLIDLSGQFLLPKFIDNHCHILPKGLELKNLNLSQCSTRDEFLTKISERHKSHPIGWLIAVQYDQNREGGDYLHRAELDPISAERPILVIHANGHASIANTAALRAAGVNEFTPDPSGGTFRRNASGEMDGVLFEDAHDLVLAASPRPSTAEMTEAILAAGEKMGSAGIGAATDMMTGSFDLLSELKAYGEAARRGCKIHLRLFLQWKTVLGPRAVDPAALKEAINNLPRDRVRVLGVKIFADGAIASATAAIYGRYSGKIGNGPRISKHSQGAADFSTQEVSGQLIYNPTRLKDMVRIAHEAGYAVATHSIGDYATDLVMDAYEATGEPHRHRIEHAMLLSDDQIDRIAKAGCAVTFQPEFLLRFGKAYVSQLGPDRSSKLKRARSLLDAGIPLSFSSDQPVVGGDPADGIRTAVNRPAGFDPAENVAVSEAFWLYTQGAAVANGDGKEMGSLKVGTWADYRVSESDPFESP